MSVFTERFANLIKEKGFTELASEAGKREDEEHFINASALTPPNNDAQSTETEPAKTVRRTRKTKSSPEENISEDTQPKRGRRTKKEDA